MDVTRVALANAGTAGTSFKFGLGRGSIGYPSEGNDGEDNGGEANEHVGVDAIELDILVVSDGYTVTFYTLKLPLLCPLWRCHAPWKGGRLNVR